MFDKYDSFIYALISQIFIYFIVPMYNLHLIS